MSAAERAAVMDAIELLVEAQDLLYVHNDEGHEIIAKAVEEVRELVDGEQD